MTNQGRSGEAEPLYRRLLAAAERVLGKEHPNTLTTMNNLASLYASTRAAMARPSRSSGARSRPGSACSARSIPIRLSASDNLAALYDDQGRYSEAEPLYKRALEASERVLGKEHPDTLASVNNLAALYFTQREWVRAAQFWRRSTAAMPRAIQRGAQDAAKPFRKEEKGSRAD